MKALRVSVEWGFGKIVSLFQYLNHEENLRLFLQPVHTAWPSLPPTPAPAASHHSFLFCGRWACTSPLQTSSPTAILACITHKPGSILGSTPRHWKTISMARSCQHSEE